MIRYLSHFMGSFGVLGSSPSFCHCAYTWVGGFYATIETAMQWLCTDLDRRMDAVIPAAKFGALSQTQVWAHKSADFPHSNVIPRSFEPQRRENHIVVKRDSDAFTDALSAYVAVTHLLPAVRRPSLSIWLRKNERRLNYALGHRL